MPVRDDRQEYLMLQRHYGRLKSIQRFRESVKIFIPERNLGMEAAHLNTMVMSIGDVETFYETPGKAGVLKTEATTRGYQFLLAQALASDGIKFDIDLFTTTPEETVETMLSLLMSDWSRLHWETAHAATAFGKDKHKLTAKVGNKSDDLGVATQQLLYYGRLIIANRSRL